MTLIEEKQRKLSRTNRYIFLACFCLMIVALVINTNRFSASLVFVPVPLMISTAAAIFLMERGQLTVSYGINFVICLSALYATLLSDVVRWNSALLSLLVFNVFYFIISGARYSGELIRQIMGFYSVSAVLISMVMLVNYAFSWSLWNGRVTITVFGVVKDANYLSAYLTPAYAYVLYSCLFGKRRLWKIVSPIVIFVAVFLTGSRAAFITLAVVTMMMFGKLILRGGISAGKVVAIVSLAGVAVGGYLLLQSASVFERLTNSDSYMDNIRLTIWGYAMEAFYRRPVFGSGVGAGTYFSHLYLKWGTHSCFIDILTGQGIFGVAMYVLLFVSFLRVKKENITLAAAMLLAFFVPLGFINGYETASFWVPMALCKIMSDYLKKNGAEQILL